MIRLGICTDIKNAALMKDIGYDYVEIGFAATAQLSDIDFARFKARVDASPLPVQAMNVLLPGGFTIYGERGVGEEMRAYLHKGFARAKALGVAVVVFGSGGARRYPEDMTQAQAYAGIARFLRMLGPIAGEYGITVAVEPLRAAECNIINHVAQAQYIVQRAGAPHLFALADLYHMLQGGEDCAALHTGVVHCHIAEGSTRVYPRAGDASAEHYAQFFAALKASDYQGRVSIEGACANFEEEAVSAFALLDALRK